ncbi:MAG: RNA methyltransferase [Fimbriiglobus sp.]
MNLPLLSRCRAVLVRPHYAGNVGAVARVMRNFGLRDLVLVDPIADRNHIDARALAVHGVDILDSARICATLADAIADVSFVMCTSGETRGLTRKGFWGTPEEKIPDLLDSLTSATAALVFGPEPHGLNVAEIAMCHGSIFIPSDPDYPSLNLSQAVTVCLYELRRQWLKRSSMNVAGVELPTTVEAQERAFAHLHSALVAVRFVWDFRGDGIFHVLRQMFVRARPTQKELNILHGLARQLNYVAKRWGVTHPDDGRPPPVEPGSPEPG